jgi:hypothetical protein
MSAMSNSTTHVQFLYNEPIGSVQLRLPPAIGFWRSILQSLFSQGRRNAYSRHCRQKILAATRALSAFISSVQMTRFQFQSSLLRTPTE